MDQKNIFLLNYDTNLWTENASEMGNLPTNGNLPIETKGKLPFVGKLPTDAKGIPGIG